MKFRELKKQTKEEMKNLASQIRIGKPLRKPDVWAASNKDERKASDQLYRNRINYRHMHIAYCEFFNNTPYEMIEQPRENNKPIKNKIESYKKIWEEEIDIEEVIEDDESNAKAA